MVKQHCVKAVRAEHAALAALERKQTPVSRLPDNAQIFLTLNVRMVSDSDSDDGDQTRNRRELSEAEIIKRKKETRKRKKEKLLEKLEKRKKVCKFTAYRL